MKKTIFYRLSFLLISCLLAVGCTEQYAIQTNTFEDALVVEATITNELKHQKIRISRTFKFEDEAPIFESGANVYMTDDTGQNYEFVQDSENYVSVNAFQAEPGKTYRLNITTADGKSYHSDGQKLTTVNEIQDLTASVATKDGQRGVQINASSFDPSNTSKFYRYEYEETYKIVTPAWSDLNLVLIPPPIPGPHSSYGVELVPRPNLDSKICYGTKASDDIILTDTNDKGEDRVDYTVRFISNQNYIISHRYSILVRQYVQNLAAYTYYKTLKQLAGSGGNIFSQNQPGFFYGNIKSATNPDEKVIGFFDVSSVSSKRIFFNYSDLFPGEPLPPYVVECNIQNFNFCFAPTNECSGGALVSGLLMNSFLYFSGSHPLYSMVAPECGDCTRFASNVIPPFWE